MLFPRWDLQEATLARVSAEWDLHDTALAQHVVNDRCGMQVI